MQRTDLLNIFLFPPSLKIKKIPLQHHLFLFTCLSVYLSIQPSTYPTSYLRMPVPVCASIFVRLSFSIFPLTYSFSLASLPSFFFFHLASTLVCQLSHVELCLSYLLTTCSLHSGPLQYGAQSAPVHAYNPA